MAVVSSKSRGVSYLSPERKNRGREESFPDGSAGYQANKDLSNNQVPQVHRSDRHPDRR
ncbi:hypothetical protein PAMP_021725 [Pampus punctatissimus]